MADFFVEVLGISSESDVAGFAAFLVGLDLVSAAVALAFASFAIVEAKVQKE